MVNVAKRYYIFIFLVSFGWTSSGLAIHSGIEPINDFNLNKYLGTWYEIARIENSFEEGLTNVTATYSLRKDGKVKVVNKGYDIEDEEWDEADGYAEFATKPHVAHLEVTFFWPFYADYVVFEIDPDYQYAFVTSDSNEYLWLLAKTPQVSQTVIERFMRVAREKNFKIEELVFVPQEKYIQSKSTQFAKSEENSTKSLQVKDHKQEVGQDD